MTSCRHRYESTKIIHIRSMAKPCMAEDKAYPRLIMHRTGNLPIGYTEQLEKEKK